MTNTTATPSLSHARVAMFADAYSQKAEETALESVLAAIRGGRWKSKVARARELFTSWKAANPALDNPKSPEAKAYARFKETLPAFTISGTAKGRKEPLEHSGLLQVDCDKLNGALESLRERVKSDPHVFFGFVSPSGDGLKLGLAIDGTRHADSFASAEKYFRDKYGVRVDDSVKDRLRLCFVSHDPDLWTNPNATPLPITTTAQQTASADVTGLILPSGNISISESARAIFERLAKTKNVFLRGGAMVELLEQEGAAGLEIIKPDAFRTRAERCANLFAWRSGGEGEPVLRPAKMSKDDAAAIMATLEAREILPPVASVLRCPVLVESGGDVDILGQGYHPELGGLLILAGETPPPVEISEAVASLKWLIEEFHFQSEGDRSRALAAFITPALRMGGFLNTQTAHVPIDVAEADDSQSGKGYRHALVCALYGESGYFVTARNGGVGSTDESFSSALIAGRPFICLDNFRGRLDSQNLEAFLTCPTLFPARIPHRGEVLINPKRFLLQMSSNGMESTRDLANRSSICRIRKRHGFRYRDTLGELQKRQSYFLGCVFSIISEWIAAGKPRSEDARHDFRQWAETLDWMVQHICGTAPLMDGHQSAQERVSNPALSWLRLIGLALEGERRLGEALSASNLVELCQTHGLEIPGQREPSDDHAKRQVGILMRRVFKDAEETEVEGYQVKRGRREYRKPSGDFDTTPEYTFAK